MLIKRPFVEQITGIPISTWEEIYDSDTLEVLNFTKINFDLTYTKIVTKKYGVGLFFLKRWKKYLETNHDLNLKNMTDFQKYISYYLLIHITPENFDLQKRILFNISRWYYLYCYRGWRHFYNLPVNGQRTWSNNKTRFRLPNLLRDYQISLFRDKYGINTKTNLNISFFTEHTNLLWIQEWYDEWLSAHEVFLGTKQKTKFFRLRINYRHFMNLQIATPKSVEFKKKKKNRKKLKAEFTVGFDSLYVVSLFSKKKHLFKHLL